MSSFTSKTKPIKENTGVKRAAKIWWTLTDEAPALATYALLPIVKRFLGDAGISVEEADIRYAIL